MATEQGLKNLAEVLPLFKLSDDGKYIKNYEDFEFAVMFVDGWQNNKDNDLYIVVTNIASEVVTLRPKPQPTYRAFKDVKEFHIARKNRMLVELSKNKTITFEYDIKDDMLFRIAGDTGTTVYVSYSFEDILARFVFLNDDFSTEPCGVKE